MNPPNAPTDFLGRTICPGDLIVYPWRRGSEMGLHKLEVQQVMNKYVVGYNNVGHRVKVTNLKNVVIDMAARRRPPLSDDRL